MEKLKVMSVVEPTEKLSQEEWFKCLGVSSGYTKPTQYFQGNELDTSKFLKKTSVEVSWHESITFIFKSLITLEWIGY
jgi:hypothetical protein